MVKESCIKGCGGKDGKKLDGKMNVFCKLGAARVLVVMLVSLALFCMQAGAFKVFSKPVT